MRLAINIDHVATLRQARGGSEPDPVSAAHLCELAGAEGIVCHLREDRRHVNDRDLRLLRETVQTRLDLEMAATDEIIGIAIQTKPELATLVPERREEKTTEGGLDVRSQKNHLVQAVKALKQGGIPVSLFVEPDREQIEAAREIGADMIEIHTGHYANARAHRDVHEHLVRIQTAAKLGKSLGLGVNAGHGLNYVNTEAIAAIKDIDELSIGHAVISRALYVGLPEAVREMLRIVKGR
ncbi:MAG: pyridoxine 5'-phosphate synthase [Ignavibacteria bacterium]|nr:pyridoxine 5'-phosphate synthase [Ignavibacteria bacterium]